MEANVTAADPVCGMTVDPTGAPAQCEHAGTRYYFCCNHCLQSFQSDPARYFAMSSVSVVSNALRLRNVKL